MIDAENIFVIGGGSSGLEIGGRLAKKRKGMRKQFRVVVAEAAAAPFAAQSGTRGGQARFHGGAHQPDPEVSATLAEQSRDPAFRGIIRHVPCTYILPAASADGIADNWRAAGVAFRPGSKAVSRLLAPSFRRRHEPLVYYDVNDKVIDTVALQSRQKRDLLRHGGQLLCNARVMGANWSGPRLTGVWTEAPGGKPQLHHCSLVIDAAGASIGEVARMLEPSAPLRLDHVLRLEACPVLRARNPFDRARIIQAWGNLAEHLAVIPVGLTGRVSVATRGGTSVRAPADAGGIDLEVERQRLLGHFREVFGAIHLSEVEVNMCVKCLLSPSGDANKARKPTVLWAADIGASVGNLLLAAPGKLSGCIALAREVEATVDRYFGDAERLAA